MNVLQEHGIAHVGRQMLKQEHLMIDETTFFNGASALLPVLTPLVQQEILPELPTLPGRWHPTGFMVFPLGAHRDYGTLRLHIWPAGIRHRVLQGRGDLGEIHDGDIHNHSWNIVSQVLTAYHDLIYQVDPLGDPAQPVAEDDPEVFRRFSVAYHPGDRQTLVTDGRHVQASGTERRVLGGGALHTIAAGVYHAPVVPLDAVGATLVFSSPRVTAGGPDILIGGTGDAAEGARRPVTPADAHEAREQLASCGI